MAYVLTVPKGDGIVVRNIAQLYYDGIDEGFLKLRIVTELPVYVGKEGKSGERDYDPESLYVADEEQITLGDGMVRIVMRKMLDGSAKFIFLNTGENGNTTYTATMSHLGIVG